MSDRLDKLTTQLTIRKTKLVAVGRDIHKCSNSLSQAEPGSENETRLIAKIAAYKADYDAYKDEIDNFQKQIDDLNKPKEKPVSKGYQYFTTGAVEQESYWKSVYAWPTTGTTTTGTTTTANGDYVFMTNTGSDIIVSPVKKPVQIHVSEEVAKDADLVTSITKEWMKQYAKEKENFYLQMMQDIGA